MNHHISSSLSSSSSSSSSSSDQPPPPPPPAKVVVKLSPNVEALRRELENYERIAGQRDDLFVKVHDYVRIANPTHMQEQAALVMEQGEQDLEQYIRQYGALRGTRLQEAMRSVAQCVQAVHASKMVWTEIKSANFVVLRSDDDDKDDKSNNSNDNHHPYHSMVIKGIDLESAVFKRENPIDFSAEAIPPCFAVDFLCGREPQAKMEKSFDIWSTGIVFFKLATGKAYFDRHKKSSTEIAMALRTAAVQQGGQGSLDLNKHGDIDEIMDAELKDLIQSCLKINPAERPTIGEVLQHAFFSKNYD